MPTDLISEFSRLHQELVKEQSQIQERLNAINQALSALGGSASPTATAPISLPVAASTTTDRRQMSAAARARMAEGQRARWAKQRGNALPASAPASEVPKKRGRPAKVTAAVAEAGSSTSAKPGKRQMSPAARKAIAAAARKRWAAARKAGKNRL